MSLLQRKGDFARSIVLNDAIIQNVMITQEKVKGSAWCAQVGMSKMKKLYSHLIMKIDANGSSTPLMILCPITRNSRNHVSHVNFGDRSILAKELVLKLLWMTTLKTYHYMEYNTCQKAPQANNLRKYKIKQIPKMDILYS